MTSELTFTNYLILIVYVQIITMLAGAVFVLAVIGGYWLFAVVALFSFFLLTVPPAMALHSRNLRASHNEKPKQQ